MFALIKWVEDGKFSILPTEHIRDFDEDEYFTGMEGKGRLFGGVAPRRQGAKRWMAGL